MKSWRYRRQRRNNRKLRGRKHRERRPSQIEQLEARRLMIGSDWTNVLNPLDVTGDASGLVAPNDVLVVINEINQRRVSDPRTGELQVVGENGVSPPPFHDVNCDTLAAPSDVLEIINFLNGVRPRPGWSFDETGGAGEEAGRFSNDSCAARLHEGNSLVTSLTSTFTVPEGATGVSFTFDNLAFDESSEGTVHDAFEAALLDTSDRSVVHPLDVGGDAYFNISEEFGSTTTAEAEHADSRVTLSLESVLPGSEVQLVVRLVNNDADTETSVLIRSVEIEFAPAGSGEGPVAAPSIEAQTATTPIIGPLNQPATSLLPPPGAIPGRPPSFVAPPTAASSAAADGETDVSVIDSRGTEFWLGFPDNLHEGNNTPQKALHITGDVATTGFVEIPGLLDRTTSAPFRMEFVVNPGTVTAVELPSDDLGDSAADDQTDFDVEAELIAAVQQRGIHVVAEDPVTVYGINRAVNTTDAFLALPVDSLGTEYVNLGFQNTFALISGANGSQFLVVATEDNTQVNIAPGPTTFTTSDSQVTVVGPSEGSNLGESANGSDIGTLLLAEGGEHTVNVQPPFAGYGGSYRFELLDLESAATAINLGDAVTANLPTGREARAYRFDATKGQEVYLDFFADDATPKVVLVGPSGAEAVQNIAADGNSLAFNGNLELTEEGTHYLLIIGEEESGFDFSFRVIDVDQTPTLQLNTEIAGTFASPGEAAIFQFEGTAGQRLLYDAFAADRDAQMTLFGPGGQTVFTTVGSQDSAPFRLAESGTHRLLIFSTRRVAPSYGFRLSDVDDLDEIPLGTSVTKSFADGRQHAYRLNVAPGQTAEVRIESGTNLQRTDFQWFDPRGERVGFDTNATDFSTAFARGGEYVLIVDGTGIADAGEVTFTVDITDSPIVAKSGFNTPQVLSIEAGGEAFYEFSGPAGTPFLIDSRDTESTNLNLVLTDPNGTSIFSGFSGVTEQRDIPDFPNVLPLSGTYRLTLRGNSPEAVGDYPFQVLDLETAATPVNANTVLSGTLPTGREMVMFAFDTEAGEAFNLNGLASSSAGYSVRVLDSLLQAVFPTGFSDAAPNGNGPFIARGGRHYVLVRGGQDAPVDYSFQIQRLSDAPSIALGERVTGTLSPGRAHQPFRIELTAGQRLYVDSLDDDSEVGNLRIRRPGGAPFYSGASNQNGDSAAFLLLTAPETGEYVVSVEGTSENETDFDFRILDLDAAPELEFGTEQSVQLDGRQAEFFRITANAPETLTFDNLASDGQFFWQLYNTAGRSIAADNNGRDFGGRALTAGTYYLGVIGRSSSNLTFQATRTVDAAVTPLGFNEVITLDVPINGAGEHSFEAPAGRLVYLNVVDSSFGIPEHSVTLDQGETYLVRDLRGATFGFAPDLTGSVVTSDQPVAVFGGSRASFIPSTFFAADHLVEQLPPTNTWGREFVTLPLETGTSIGDRFRFLAQTDGTEVNINGELVATLGRGEFHETTLTEPAHIQSNGSILVAQYAHSQNFYRQANGGDPEFSGDPLMIVVPPLEQFLSSYTVSTPAEESIPEPERFDRNFINVLAPTGSVGQIELDGVPIDVDRFTPIGDSGFSGAQVPVALGSYELASPLPFGTFVYGFGTFDSYGYTGGQALTPVAEVASVSLTPKSASTTVNESLLFTARVADDTGAPLEGVRVDFSVAGANPRNGFGFSNASGLAQFSYVGTGLGRDIVSASVGQLFDDSIVDWQTDAALPELTVTSPLDGSAVPAGTTLVATGWAMADFPNATLDLITVNGVPLENIDAAGNFFVSLFVGPGENEFEFTAIDSSSRVVSQVLTISGNQPNANEIDFSQFSDVTGSFDVAYARTSYNRVRQELHAETAVENVGQFPADAPLLVGVTNLSDPTVLVRDADGVTPDGIPYYDFTGLVTGGSLNPRGQTGFLSANFYNPSETQFDYELVFFAKLNDPPEFTSLPATEADLESQYRYDAEAVDPTGEQVSFELLEGPATMSIDATTGLVRWTPTAADAGNHRVEIEVSDERLGVSRQAFVITARPAPQNRAPVFTSLPGGLAEVGNEYRYLAQATDADNDGLTFSIQAGPAGMTIDENTGQLSWQPSVERRGEQQVAIVVTDGVSSAQQNYNLVVVSPADNSAPVILNSPPTAAKLGQLTHQIIALDGDNEPLSFALLDGPAGMTVDSSGLLRWDVTAAEVGTHRVVVEVVDSRGGSDRQEFDLSIFDNADPTIGSDPVLTATVDSEYSYQLQSTDSDGDSLSYSLESAPAGMSVDASGLVRWPVTSAAYEEERVAIRVLDGRGGSAEQEFTISVTGGVELARNITPFFVSTAPEVASVGTQYSYAVQARDPNGDSLTYDLPLGPTGMVIDASTGLLGWQPQADQSGTQQVVIRVNDGQSGGIWLQSFSIEVDSANTPPVIVSAPIATATVGSPWEYSIIVQDAEEDALSFELAAPAAGLTLQPVAEGAADAILSFTPTIVGTTEVAFTVDDGRGGISEQRFAIETVGAAANVAPIVDSVPRTSIAAGQPWIYLPQVHDPNADPISISLIGAPDGMTLSEELQFVSWQPTAEQLGSHEVMLTFDDGRGGTTEQNFNVDVIATNDNQAPQIVSPPTAFRATVGSPFAYDLRAKDANEDPVEWSLVTAPSGTSLDPRAGTLRWTPARDQLGTQRFVIAATDPAGAQAQQSFSLVVSGANLAPRILSSAPSEAVLNSRYVYGVRAIDPEGGVLDYELTAGPDGMTLDADRGIVRWTPVAGQTGIATATLEVTDSQGNSSAQTFSINVTEIVPNQAPVITSRAQFRARVDALYEYDVEAMDVEGDGITFGLVEFPEGMEIDSASGVITWTPSVDQAGAQLVRVFAEDTEGNVSEQRFALLARVNQAPVITSQAPLQVSLGGVYRYDVQVDDADGDGVEFSLVEGPAGMTIDPLGRVHWETEPGVPLSNSVTVAATDTFGATVTQQYTLDVTPDTTSPVVELQLTANPLALGGDSVVIVQASDDVGVIELTLMVDGVPRVLDANNTLTIRGESAGQFNLQATAKDASGNEGAAEVTLRVFDPADTEGPSISITSPQPNAVITTLTDIVGSVTDDNLDFFRVDYGRADLVDINEPAAQDDDYKTLTTSDSAATDEVLATFDPTMLINDDYVVRVLAQDLSGNVSARTVLLSLDGQLKLGQFTLDSVDLSVPVAGIPITILRSYDTRDSERRGDFGFGWTLSVSDPQIRESLPVSQFERQGLFHAAIPFREGTRVYLTNPEGRRVAFTFRPQRQFSLFGGGSFSATFVPDPGVYDRLDVGTPQLRSVNGAFYNGFDGSPFNPSAYRLTTRSGNVYEYGQFTGLSSIQDPNGNRVDVRSDGIHGSNGTSVEIRRDPLGRIAEIIDPAGNRLTYSYDSNGDLSAFTDQVNDQTRYEYRRTPEHFLDSVEDARGIQILDLSFDEEGRLTETRDALGNSINQSIDTDNSLFIVTDANGNVTSERFDERGNVVERIDANGNATIFEYLDPRHPYLESSIVNRNGHRTEFEYDERGNLTVETGPNGDSIQTSFNADSNVTGTIDELGRSFTVVYDSSQNAVQTIGPAGEAYVFEYDNSGRVIARIDRNGERRELQYGAGDLPTSLTLADGAIRNYEYNHLGQVTKFTDELGNATQYEYDAKGRLTRLVLPSGQETVSSYDGNLLVSQRDRFQGEVLRTTLFRHDDNGRVIERVNAEGGSTQYEYDANGNVTALRDPGGNVTRFTFDSLDRMTSETDALEQTTRYTYDPEGNLTDILDRNGRRRQFEVDAMNQTVAEIWSSQGEMVHEITFGYDAVGNLVAASDSTSTLTFSYDVEDQIRTVVSEGPDLYPTVVLEYEYDAEGNRTRTADSLGFVVDSTLDSRNRLVERSWTRQDGTGAGVSVEYDARGLPALVSRFSDPTRATSAGLTAMEYDGSGRVVEIAHRTAADVAIADYRFQYDPLGRVVSESHNGEESEYRYDKIDQLLSANHSERADESYRYDSGGNRIESHLHGDGYRTGGGNRLLSDGEFDYEYDAEGNLVRKVQISTGNETLFTYDHRNRLTAVVERSAGGVVLNESEFEYDVFNRRIVTRTNGLATISLYDGDHTWLDLDEQGNVLTRYLQGLQVDGLFGRIAASGETIWHLSDRLQSVRDHVNNAGQVVSHRDFDSFGNVVSATGPAAADRFGFTGREFDPTTDLHYYRHRFYDSNLGRFVNQDPVGFSAGDPNLYRYVGNNPTNLVDPFGLEPPGTQEQLTFAQRQQLIERSICIIEALEKFLKPQTADEAFRNFAIDQGLSALFGVHLNYVNIVKALILTAEVIQCYYRHPVSRGGQRTFPPGQIGTRSGPNQGVLILNPSTRPGARAAPDSEIGGIIDLQRRTGAPLGR